MGPAGLRDRRARPPAAGELVLDKEHASAFAGTPLVGHLVEHRVDTLLITGCSTSACVRATATDAKSNGLKPIIIREAVAGSLRDRPRVDAVRHPGAIRRRGEPGGNSRVPPNACGGV